MVVLKKLIFNSFYYWAGYPSLERTDFLHISTLGECMVVWIGTDFLIVSTLGGYGGLEGTEFEQFLYKECVVVL